MSIISPEHARWPEFCENLAELVNFHQDEAGEWRWSCGEDGDRLGHAKRVAKMMGFTVVQTGMCCDCEILFNEAPEDEDEEVEP